MVRGAAALDYLSTFFGLALTVAPILGTPQLRFYLKLTINYVSRGKFFHVEQTNVQAENIFDIQGDPNIQISKGKADYSPNELVERVYTPLLNQTTSWLDPGTPFVGLGGGGNWSDLETKVPYLLKLVPPDIAAIFKQAKALQGRINVLALSMPVLLETATIRARSKLNLMEVGSAQAIFRIRFGPGTLQHVALGTLWASGKTLTQYATDFISENYPGSDLDLDFVVGNTVVGDHKVALVVDEVAQTCLGEDDTAIEFRQKHAQLKDLGLNARRRIDEELERLVRLKP